MARQHKYVLTAEQFDAILPKLDPRVEANNIEAARKVMVDGRGVMEVAEEYGRTRQNLHRFIREMFALHTEVMPEIPKSWVRVAVSLPPALARQVRALEKSALAELKPSRKDSEP